MVTIPAASEINFLQWDTTKSAGTFSGSVDDFFGSTWVKMDVSVGKTYDLFAHGLGSVTNDAKFTVFNATGEVIIDATFGYTYKASLTPTSSGPLYIQISMSSNFPGEVDLDVTTTSAFVKQLGLGDQTYSGSYGERILGFYGNDQITILSAFQASGGLGNDTIYSNANSHLIWGDEGNDYINSTGGNDTVFGGSGRDTIDMSGAGNVEVYGGTGNDWIYISTTSSKIFGGSGGDYIRGGSGIDAIDGGANGDSLDGGGGADYIKGGAGSDRITGGLGKDRIWGDDANDSIDGGDDADTIFGGTGADTIVGGAGDDTIDGGSGRDRLYGGQDSDLFVFRKGDTGTTKASADTIYDFTSADHIDLHLIDASTKVAGDQTFTFIGTSAFHGKAGELRYEKLAGDTYIYGDVNGDKKADLVIHLDDAVAMTKAYFVL